MKKMPSKGTIIRTACLVLTTINMILTLIGKSPLPISNDDITLLISEMAVVISSWASHWYNNSFTQKAIEADEYLHG